MWKNVVDLSEPKPDIRSAFRVVIDNNWQGIAYLMLEVAGLDFIEAIQVSYTSARVVNIHKEYVYLKVVFRSFCCLSPEITCQIHMPRYFWFCRF